MDNMYIIDDGTEAKLNYIKISAPSVYERILPEVGGKIDRLDFRKRMIVAKAVNEAFEVSGNDAIIVSDQSYEGILTLKKVLTKKASLSINGKYRIIEESCFLKCVNLESLVFEEGVEQINDGVIRNQTKLKRVSFPESLKFIGQGAFINCKNLLEVRFGNPRTRMHSHSFAGTKWLEENENEFVVVNGQLLRYHGNEENIAIPNGTICVRNGAFDNNDKVRVVRCPVSLEEICVCAFENCIQLENVILNNRLKYIGYHAFWGCDNLKEVVLPRSLEWIQEEAFDPDTVIRYDGDNQELVKYIQRYYPKRIVKN